MSDWSKQSGRLQEVLMDFLWDQWIALGVAGRGTGLPSVPFVVDPEALLLATIRFGGGEARMVEEVLDWLVQNGGLISLQRLKNLQANSRVGSREGLDELGRFMEEAGHRNWKTLPGWAAKVSSPTGRGWVPKAAGFREMSQTPECSRPEVFLLRLRGAFGVSARPEVMNVRMDKNCWSKSRTSISNQVAPGPGRGTARKTKMITAVPISARRWSRSSSSSRR